MQREQTWERKEGEVKINASTEKGGRKIVNVKGEKGERKYGDGERWDNEGRQSKERQNE